MLATIGTYPSKLLECAVGIVARIVFKTAAFFNKYRPRPSFTPRWSDKPLLKSWQRTKPQLGWPRLTDSLCPGCVKEARRKILGGEKPWQVLQQENIGEIKAQIVERGHEIWMVKECPQHGKFEDLMAIDSKFLAWIERNFPGRDIPAHNDRELHDHGSSSIKHGRGTVLTIDLTNRCNMMCDPCFMDANQVGFVHELGWEEIKQILDNATTIKPKRQMVIQFSGGEPTLSPHLIKAIRYAHDLGYNTVQVATNGVRFAQTKGFAREAANSGLQYAYLQFDGIGNDANKHRKVGNLFDVKLQAIQNLHEAGIGIVLVTTLINGVNNDQVGPIIRFARDNPIVFVAFQPVSFTGRDEEITPERRLRQRYTLSHLAYDVKKQTGLTEPTRDWFPLSLLGPFSDVIDFVNGPQADWGRASCGCHPNCGIVTGFMINRETKEMAPIPEVLDIPSLVGDIQKITDAGRGRSFSKIMIGLALLKNYRPFKAPASLALLDILKALDKGFGLTSRSCGRISERRNDCWSYLAIGGMWFQDLFNYDFRRTEMCVVPYATKQGEISFCAYNTGVGWRKIIENIHKNATAAEWYKKYGRHEIYANGRDVKLENLEHSLKINPEDALRLQEKDTCLGTEERRRQREAAGERARMRQIYEEMVLSKRTNDLVQLRAGTGLQSVQDEKAEGASVTRATGFLAKGP